MYPMYPLFSLKTPSFGLEISRVRFQGSWNSCYLALGNEPICPNQLRRRIWGDPRITLKSHQVSSQSPVPQISWKLVQGHPKSWKMDPGIMRIPTSVKVEFCNTSLAKCLVFQSQTPRFRPKNHQKKKPWNRYEQIMFFDPNVPKNLFKWDP